MPDGRKRKNAAYHLTIEQKRHFALEPSMEAKNTSPTYQSFVDKYPELINSETGIADAFELEALSPEDLAQTLEDARRNTQSCETVR